MDSISKDKFWDLKPKWCQPWSIISFGVLVIASSWTLFNKLIITLILGSIIIIWWVLFLIIVPYSYKSISEKK